VESLFQIRCGTFSDELWSRRSNILYRMHRLFKRARGNAVAVDDSTCLVEAIRELPKMHRVMLMLLAYRRLLKWIKRQAAKRGVAVIEVNPKGTSTTCLKCYGGMEEVGHRRMKLALVVGTIEG